MRAFSFRHLENQPLLHRLVTAVAHGCVNTAETIALIAEVDARKLYLPAGYPSMFAYCVHVLRMSDDAAYRRITAARAALQFPAIFEAVAEGRLHLTAVGQLAPHLTRENAVGLLAAAMHQTKAEIDQLLATRFPRTEVLPMVHVSASQPLAGDPPATGESEARTPERAGELVPERVEFTRRSRVAPLSAQSFELHVTIGHGTHEMLRYAQALLGHQVRSDDLAELLDRALRALIVHLEKSKLGKTARPRRTGRGIGSLRHVPAEVKRTVWERDQGQCTFVGETGHRCVSRTPLEFDHVDPLARGGGATVENLRLRCRAHNQYEAERRFGAGFMEAKREEARRAVELRQACAKGQPRVQRANAEPDAGSTITQHDKDIVAGLRDLGFRADQARRAAEFCRTLPVATLEERMRTALSFLAPKTRPVSRVGNRGVVPT